MSTERIDGYANALFEVAQVEGSLDDVENELFQLARALESNDELRTTLTDELIPVERRQGVVEDLLGNRASPVTVSLVSFIVGAGRGRQLPAIVDRLVARAAEAKNKAVAEVRTAVPLTDDQRTRLADARPAGGSCAPAGCSAPPSPAGCWSSGAGTRVSPHRKPASPAACASPRAAARPPRT